MCTGSQPSSHASDWGALEGDLAVSSEEVASHGEVTSEASAVHPWKDLWFYKLIVGFCFLGMWLRFF